MEKKEWFEAWFDTPYYHILYQNRDEAEAKDFIDRLIRRFQPAAGARMLDLACGRGRYACHLAEKGFDVTGLDLSENNIQYARRYENELLHFYRHDMRRPFRTNFYDYILNVFTSFGYFATERDHIRTLRNVRAGLRPSGLFILDYFNSPYIVAHLQPWEEKRMDGIFFEIQKKIAAGRILKQISFSDQGRSFCFTESVLLFELKDFTRLFNQTGLRIVNTFGDYELCPFDVRHSPRLIIIAEKDDRNTPI